ncbi:MarR family winged helix-turn-helix transcriptional regulator [Alicyclobacillus dauci]|uniref:MarR family transcriptional regulator n=1 Tax=Alicyclobacillus dauci TaxID=1475485 RepID=A0ABY6Z2X4_9BACL|nr:MarR family transcriptional regulator [Alicyclobacillus dauci]WAH37238.1 MarR family transcriptional regulator [Alicyclobacillus dauci]
MTAYNPLTDSMGFLLGQTFRRVSYLTNLRFRSHDITAEQWILLLCLKERGSITQTELAEASGKDKTTVTRLLDNLERKGMVTKCADEADRRARLIDVTPKGRRTAEELVDVEKQVLDIAMSGLAPDEVAQLRALLVRIQRNVKAETDM